MHHDSEFTIVTIVVAALAIGAVMRVFARRTGIPFTVAMLSAGGLGGLALRAIEGEHSGIVEILGHGGGISPHLIIFVFLPALVFESSFAIDTHSLRKNLGAIVVLAVPMLIVATGLTALMMVGITGSSWGWSLPAALVFGALISATDPVAVVAILREVGAPKRLGVLIEGESLFNDGTAIVVFTVLLASLSAGDAADLSVGGAFLSFLKVAGGGIGVGLAFGILATAWMARTFDDPMVEITLTLILAYAAMLVAEGVLHVSGVLAVVTAGLYMSGRGRYRISPEVRHFLEEFWEMLAYMANALIFFLVGAIISTQLGEMGWQTLLITLAAFVGLVVIRFALIFAFLPMINKVGPRVTGGQASVMAWGGLRGAVSLALALAVAQDAAVDPILGAQILQVTAGIVLLTIVVNGMSTGALLKRLGFDLVPLTERLAELRSRSGVLASVAEHVEQSSHSPDLRTVRWDVVKEDVERRAHDARDKWKEAKEEFDLADPAERASGLWRRALAIERQSYRKASRAGTLGAPAFDLLRREVDLHLDSLDRGDLSEPDLRTPEGRTRNLLARMARGVGREFGGAEFRRLSLKYDLWRAEAQAAGEVRETMSNLREADPEVVDKIVATYAHYQRDAKERMEDIRVNLPEVATAIETRLAHRIALNAERGAFGDAAGRGELGAGALEKALGDIRHRMKELHFERPEVAISETADLCRQTDLFRGLPEEVVDLLADMTVEQVLPAGEYLFRAGDRGDAMYIIARGLVHILDEEGMLSGGEAGSLIALLTGGDILGEMALLSGAPRTAAAKAASTVTLGRISKSDFDTLMSERPRVRARIWDAYGRRLFDNLLRADRKLAHLVGQESRRWYCAGEMIEPGEGERVALADARYALLIHGRVTIDGRRHDAPALVSLGKLGGSRELSADAGARVVLLGAPAEELAGRPTEPMVSMAEG